jgi:hypothetical protein
MQEPVGIAGRCFEGVTECVTEIEQSSFSLLRFVGCDYASLGPAANFHGMKLRLSFTLLQVDKICVKPAIKVVVAQECILYDFSIACEELPLRQGPQQVQVGNNGRWLVEGPDEVLSLTCIDAGLATNRAIHLR